MESIDEFMAKITDPSLWQRPPEPTRILWSGLTGRVGTAALAAARSRDDVKIVAGLSRRHASELSTNDNFKGLAWCQYDIFSLLFFEPGQFDVIVDFSHPEQLETIAEAASMMRKPLIIGTTKLSHMQLVKLRHYTEFIPIFLDSNFRFKVKVFLDRAVAWAIDHPNDLILFEKFDKGGELPIAVYEVLRQRVADATGEFIGFNAAAVYEEGSSICDWEFGDQHCCIVGLDGLVHDVMNIAKVMAKKPRKDGEFYTLDDLWPDLQSQG